MEIIPCPIVREPDGLAMSSRNMRLSAAGRSKAPLIYKTLQEARKMAQNHDVATVKKWVTDTLKSIEGFEPEYFEIASGETLLPVNQWDEANTVMGFVVVWLEGVRLIDNIELRRKHV